MAVLATRVPHVVDRFPVSEHRCSSSGPFLPSSRVRPHATTARKIQVRQVPVIGGSEPDSKVAKLTAKHRRRIRLPDYAESGDESLRIGEFLRHPSGVKSMLNTKALQSFDLLEPNKYRCALPSIQFLKFEVVPVIDLLVISTNEDCTVELLSCKFEGSETLKEQNDRFSASMKNRITWEDYSAEPYMDFNVDLNVSLEVYTKPFTLLPISAVETPGNLILQGLLDKLVPLHANQLLEDYGIWVEEKQQSF